MKPHVVVIGAGLSGLAAAYRLITSQEVHVTILERRDRIGGRTLTTEVNGKKVDLGGFIIYPWYRKMRELIEGVGLSARLEPFIAPRVYIQSGDRFIQSSREIFSIIDGFRYLKALPRAVGTHSPHKPRLNAYRGMTVGELLGRGSVAEYFDTLAQGYCYGSIFETSAATTVPVMIQSALHGDIRKSHYFPEGLEVLTEQLTNEITERGGEIILGARAEAYENGHVRLCTGRTFAADAVVYAGDVDGSIPKGAISFVQPPKYTNFATAVLKVDQVKEVQENWGALFVRGESNPSALSFIHLERLHGSDLAGYVAANVRLEKTEELSAAFFETELQRRGIADKVLAIETIEYWQRTMPIMKEADIAALRKAQGENGLYFAGDWLGCPSMESAVANGIAAAEQLLNTYIK